MKTQCGRKTTCCYHLCLLFNIKKICLQSCIGANSYQYAGTHLQKATTFSRSPAYTGRELQPPSSCTSWYVYHYIGVDLQKATTFSLPPGTKFHKFSDWMLLVHNNTHEGLISSNFHTGPIITPINAHRLYLTDAREHYKLNKMLEMDEWKEWCLSKPDNKV